MLYSVLYNAIVSCDLLSTQTTLKQDEKRLQMPVNQKIGAGAGADTDTDVVAGLLQGQLQRYSKRWVALVLVGVSC